MEQTKGVCMDTHGAIRRVAKLAGKTQGEISTGIGKSERWLSATFAAASDSKAGTVAAIAEVCGYRLALVPADHARWGGV